MHRPVNYYSDDADDNGNAVYYNDEVDDQDDTGNADDEYGGDMDSDDDDDDRIIWPLSCQKMCPATCHMTAPASDPCHIIVFRPGS